MASFFFCVVFGTRTQKALHSPVVCILVVCAWLGLLSV